MKKQTMLLFLAMSIGSFGFAQGVINKTILDKTSGSFNLKNGSQNVSAQYSVKRPNAKQLIITVLPQSTAEVNVRLVDKSGNVVFNLPSKSVTGRYVEVVDMTQFKKGEYFVDFKTGENSSSQVAVDKATLPNSNQ